MNISKSCYLSIPEHLHSVVFDEKDGYPSSVTLLNYESGEFYALDGAGLDFWNLLEEEKRLEDIVTELSSIYDDINADQLWRDIEALVASLIEKGLLNLLDPLA